MKVLKVGLTALLITMLIAAIVAGSFFLYREKHKTEDELIELEAQQAEILYQQNLEYALKEAGQYDFIVVLNPAHGGYDTSGTYYREKEITLAVCQQVREQNTDPKIGIFLTRNTDIGLSDEMRREFAVQLEADLFVDVHLNKSSSGNEHGTSVSYETAYYNRKLTNVSFADIMEKNVVSAIEGYAVGITDVTDEDKLPILDGLTMPAVSIACGDLTDETEGELLGHENYQKNIACGIYAGILEAKAKLTQ